MRDIAIKQVLFLPIGALLILMLVGLTVPGYSSISEHLSALGLLGGYPAVSEQIAGVVSGASIIIFSLALYRHPCGEFPFTMLTSVLFGLNMLSNGVFPMGNPLHGLYGIGFFSALTPAFLAAEIDRSERTKIFFTASKWVAAFTLLYFWSMISGADPKGFRGLTQRLAVIPIMGWYSFAGYALLRASKAGKESTALSPSHSTA